MQTDTVSIAEFIASNRITMTAERVDSNPNMPDSNNMDHWKAVLMRKVLREGFDTFHGVEYDGFEDFCSNMGYDSDSRSAERIYRACVHGSKRLKTFLGESLFSEIQECERL